MNELRVRKRHILVELGQLPWWVSAVFAAGVFAAMRWMAPAFAESRPLLAPLAAAAASLAGWLASVFLLPIPFALAHAAKRRRLAATAPRLDEINALSWQDFEALVAEVYKRRGYAVTERGGSTADGGVDLELRAKQQKIVVQCKRWKTQVVGVDRVRELLGAMTAERASAAIFVCSGRYTPDAITFARGKAIELVDGAKLVELLAEIQKPLAAKPASSKAELKVEPRLPAKSTPVSSDPFSAEAASCPKCGSAMVRRVAKQGTHAGTSFWGCSRFPNCRGILPAA